MKCKVTNTPTAGIDIVTKVDKHQTADSGGGGGYFAHDSKTRTSKANLGNPTNSGTGAGNPGHGKLKTEECGRHLLR